MRFIWSAPMSSWQQAYTSPVAWSVVVRSSHSESSSTRWPRQTCSISRARPRSSSSSTT
ncbi:hypothetical protein [Actinoallomurus soli]|uniref:hypothetical protein n=1 Tax=Actinoallomurus soli TaxID=2952535 RepID=UPI0020932B43|nr:hypothetical protein [Actinoallomurus soli]MCO5969069.1 hypothetical protein [Actinoallomurus soli]